MTRQTLPWILATVGTLGLAVCALADGAAQTQPAPTEQAKAVMGCFGTYNASPRAKDGHVDLQRLLDELVELRANTYNWLVWRAPTDWDDLQRFLPMARRQNIRVWVSLVPPSESPPQTKLYSEPFKLDYDEWAKQIGQLSGREPNLVAWSIDDFVHNLKVFTPEKTRHMRDLARAGNPKIAFVPCSYFRQVTPKFAAEYRDALDGILFPYRNESVKANLTDAGAVENEVHRLRELMGPGIPIVVDVYATAHSQLGASTPEYVRDVMEAGRRSADGVLIYCHQDKVKDAAKYEVIRKAFTGWTETAARKSRP